MSVRLSLAALAALLFLTGCGKEYVSKITMEVEPVANGPLPTHWTLPDFQLTERNGQPLRLADLAGKVWVADFFYTTCPGPCPMLSSRLSDVQKAVGAEPGVRLVSISVDPKNDTPDVLKTYADRFHASERWLFATGPKDAIYSLARDGFKLPVADAPAEGGQIIHTTRLILVDQAGTVRGFYEGADPAGVEQLVRDIRRLLGEK